MLIVAARTSGKPGDKNGITLFLVAGNAKGLTREKLKSVDSRGVADLTFDNVEVGADDVLGSVDHGFSTLDAVLDRARAGMAAEMLGQASQSFDITLEYLKTRVAIRTADRHLPVAAASRRQDVHRPRAGALLRRSSAHRHRPRRQRCCAALLARENARVGDVCHLVSNEMVQMHGGIGMTDAHDAGLYLKRARVQEATLAGRRSTAIAMRR